MIYLVDPNPRGIAMEPILIAIEKQRATQKTTTSKKAAATGVGVVGSTVGVIVVSHGVLAMTTEKNKCAGRKTTTMGKGRRNSVNNRDA